MEIACVIDSRVVAPTCPGRSGGLRPGHHPLPDPVEAAELTEAMVRRLESVGAAVESERAGEAFFAVDGLWGVHGGDRSGVVAAARRAVGPGWRIGVAPTRLAAFAAAWKTPGRRLGLTRGGSDDDCCGGDSYGFVAPASLRSFVAGLRVSVLPLRLHPSSRFARPGTGPVSGSESAEAKDLADALQRLGVSTLGDLAAISADQVADRFGRLGLEALRLARGEERPLRPRVPHEELVEEIELPEGTAGRQLDRALALLVDRLLAAPQRRGRTLLGLRLGALLSAGGSWSVDQWLGRPSASARVLRSVLAPRLQGLPGPVTALQLRALGLGPPAADQIELSLGDEVPRRRRLGEAVREVRATQGSEALLRILPVDSASRVPERWAMLTPFPEQ